MRGSEKHRAPTPVVLETHILPLAMVGGPAELVPSQDPPWDPWPCTASPALTNPHPGLEPPRVSSFIRQAS